MDRASSPVVSNQENAIGIPSSFEMAWELIQQLCGLYHIAMFTAYKQKCQCGDIYEWKIDTRFLSVVSVKNETYQLNNSKVSCTTRCTCVEISMLSCNWPIGQRSQTLTFVQIQLFLNGNSLLVTADVVFLRFHTSGLHDEKTQC